MDVLMLMTMMIVIIYSTIQKTSDFYHSKYLIYWTLTCLRKLKGQREIEKNALLYNGEANEDI